MSYLNTTRPSWEKIASSPEEFLVSPRDKKPLVVLYGDKYSKQRSSAAPVVAYEESGIDGKHWAVGIRGTIEELDSEQIKSLAPKP